MMFGAAAGASMIGTIFDDKIGVIKEYNPEGARLLKRLIKLSEGASDYYLQQTISVMFSNNLSYGPFQYKYGLRKFGIFYAKSIFYSLPK
jgi:hypothetical protein